MASEKNNSTKNILITVIVAVIVGAVGFFGGMKYQQSTAVSKGQYANGAGGAGGRFGQGAGGGRRGGFGGAVVGQILSQDANSLTVKLSDGSSKIVNLSSSTTYSKSTSASATDLTVGARVAVFGASASDGSITAQNVSINPMMRAGGGGPGAAAGGARPSGMPQ